jgi:hypothetical protein
MKAILSILIAIHGLIHLMGFAKAFNMAEIKELTQPISKILGIGWGLSFLLFIAVAFFIYRNNFWWLLAMIAVGLSQVLVISSWQDAKYATILNVFILLLALIGFSQWHFEESYKNDVGESLLRNKNSTTDLLTEKDLQHLPTPVQKYLRYVGVLNKPKVAHVKIVFDGEMRGKGKDWFAFTSQQYNFYDEPDRLFFMKAKVNGLPTAGYHAYKDGSARMDVKVLSLVPVVQVSGEEMFKGESVTVLNDMCLLVPAALIDKRLTWEPINNTSTKVIFTHSGISVSAMLYFNEEGQLLNFISDDRYETTDQKNYRFSTPVRDYKNFNGYLLPGYGEAIWHYPDGEFVYGKFYLKEISYNEVPEK